MSVKISSHLIGLLRWLSIVLLACLGTAVLFVALIGGLLSFLLMQGNRGIMFNIIAPIVLIIFGVVNLLTASRIYRRKNLIQTLAIFSTSTIILFIIYLLASSLLKY